ncbi:MAG: GIY-YIG nuclease family protein [Pseudomonadaceae bacterium]|nr:GIY-YIG nuclease family protein [Pseudomonadaceae bacterium]
MDKGGYVYILTNRPDGILYVGVTASLHKRMQEHRDGVYEGFSKKYGLKTLVYWEEFADIRDAIAREKQIKKWNRAWKVGLILQTNDAWEDLYETLD